MNFIDKLSALLAKATEGVWYVGSMDKPDGHALAWLGDVYIDTDAPKVNGTRYKEPKDDAELIAYLRNHAQDFIRLMEAAENMRDCKGRYHTEQATTKVFEALAAFKEQNK
jgi:hypothetical protein